jgi:hypothetical protein
MTDKELIEKMEGELGKRRLSRFTWGPEIRKELQHRYKHLSEGRHIDGIIAKRDSPEIIQPIFGDKEEKKEREFHMVEVSIVKDHPDPNCRIKSFEKIPEEVDMKDNSCAWALVAAVERQIRAVNFMLGALKAKNVELGSACIVELALAKEDLVLALNECRKELTKADDADIKANEEKGA